MINGLGRLSPTRRAAKHERSPEHRRKPGPHLLHQEIELKAGPQRVFEILLDSKQFAAFIGMPANIDPAAGDAFSMFDGLMVGRNIELIPNQRIVQAWRPTRWDPGVYSIVKFELKLQGSGTLLILDRSGFPEGEYDHLFEGW
jgi:activator of HSP90 ATPase